jgi:hypothetical protein
MLCMLRAGEPPLASEVSHPGTDALQLNVAALAA